MSDTEGSEEKQFEIEVAKNGRAGCKRCKQKCLQGEIRIAKIVPNPFGEGKMKSWHHLNCLFDVFKKQRATTKRIETADDIAGFEILGKDDQNLVNEKISEIRTFFGMPDKPKKLENRTPKKPSKTKDKLDSKKQMNEMNDDNLFKTFQQVVALVAKHASYLDKTGIIRDFFERGTNKKEFEGDVEIWCRLLLPQSMKRIYNLQSKQLVKLFSRILMEDQDEMMEHLEKGDISETIAHFYEQSRKFKPLPRESTVTIQRVDNFLAHLSKLTKEDEQISHFETLLKKLTPDDLRTIIRLIKHDLRMGAGPKHILEGIHPDAYKVYHASKDLDDVVSRCFGNRKGQSADIKILTPVFPMLAEACKSIEQAMKKCVNGMYSEIKYDGERVQVHKHGNEFKYFSRSLKPVMPHKVAHFKEYINKAFPHAKDLILDCEILMMDATTGKPLPFGTLGVHKKVQFKDATVCLFVFDCIYYNGKSLMKVPLRERKRILHENMIEVPNHIVFSEMKEIDDRETLSEMIADVLKQGLEGLVLKDVMSIYEPGKRHWLKVKKDYLFGGAMADSADLIVLGAWYGTGKKGGMMSVFLMGCYNPHRKKFCTVTKVHTGHDDKTLERLQTELKMEKISGDPNKVPSWLVCTRTMVPDFVAADPKQQPVWEITGAELTQIHDVHTADGISIRFPRVTKIRDDKNWETATNLDELRFLFKKSKEDTDVSLLLKAGGKKRQVDDDSTSVSATNSSNSNYKKALKDSPISSRDSSITSLDSPKKKIKREHSTLSDSDGSLKLSKNEHTTDKKRKHDESLALTSDSPNKISKANIKNSIKKVKVKEPLAELFKGIKGMFLGNERSEAERYFIAYGGSTDIDIGENATHVFHFGKKIKTIPQNLPKTARNLHANWIVDSVNNMKLEGLDAYTVLWISDQTEDILDFDRR